MIIIPLSPIPSQNLTIGLGGQSCQISIYQRHGLFCDLQVNNSPIILGAVCQNQNRIVRDAYLGFLGDLMFFDTQGNEDPDYLGLGGRYQFAWLSPSDLPPGVG